MMLNSNSNVFGVTRRTQEGRGGLQGENPGASPNSGPIFPERLSSRKFPNLGRNRSVSNRRFANRRFSQLNDERCWHVC